MELSLFYCFLIQIHWEFRLTSSLFNKWDQHGLVFGQICVVKAKHSWGCWNQRRISIDCSQNNWMQIWFSSISRSNLGVSQSQIKVRSVLANVNVSWWRDNLPGREKKCYQFLKNLIVHFNNSIRRSHLHVLGIRSWKYQRNHILLSINYSISL